MYSIAVIEDNPGDIFALEMALQSADIRHEIWNVLSEEAGIEALFSRPKAPDIIVLDAVLPGDIFNKLIPRIKASPALSNVPIIVLSGIRNRVMIQRLMDLGATDFFTKPFSLEEWRVIGEHLKRTLGGLNRDLRRVLVEPA